MPESASDLVTSSCDAINYFFESEDVKRMKKLDGKCMQFQIYHPKERFITLQSNLFIGEN